MDEKNQGKNERRIIGLDMHPDLFTGAALIGNNAHEAKTQWIKHGVNSEHLEKWVERNIDPNDLIVLEASGNSFETVARIESVGRSAVVLESFQASRIGKHYCSTDKESAVNLARIYLSGLAKIVWVPDDKTRCRREIFHRYQQTVNDTKRGICRIKSWLREYGISFKKFPSFKKESTLDYILQLRQWDHIQKQLFTEMFNFYLEALERKKKYKSIIAIEVANDKNLFKLTRLLGINIITAFALGAFIGDIKRFQSAKKLAAYFGLIPKVALSGNGGFIGHLAKNAGRKDVRPLLIQSAQSILNSQNSDLFKWGHKLVFRKGRNLAVVAIARKLIVACWYLLNGFVIGLEEIPQHLIVKIDKIASAIGSKNIKQWGYKTVKEFKEEKLSLFLEKSFT